MNAAACLRLLASIRGREAYNSLRAMTGWEWVKRSLFTAAGLLILFGLYVGFKRVLTYLETIELIGGLLTWKLTAMALLTTYWMVVVSNLIAAISTLFFARDLGFLLSSPAPARSVFLMKAVEASVYASWMVALALVPFILALAQVKGLGAGFMLAFMGLSLPFLALAAAIGVLATLALMHLFPSSRTRDAVWVLSSMSMAAIYIVIRFAEPERLARPDVLEQVAQYLHFLQAPTAPYFPSWWMTTCLMAYAAGNWPVFGAYAALLVGGAVLVYVAMTWWAGSVYLRGVSGAQEGSRRNVAWDLGLYPERRLAAVLGRSSLLPVLLWRERKLFWRDVKHWSQLMLILALVVVYLFSIWRLPVDTPDLKSLVSFLSIAAAGFVMAALGLRFTFPAVSMEGKAFWVMKAAPMRLRTLLIEKFLFSVVPMMVLGGLMVGLTNRILGADRFIGLVNLGSILLMCWTLAGMGVGFGAMFPKFEVENIHQIESSAGGFAYMACALGYIGAMLALEAAVVQTHFSIKFGRLDGWIPEVVLWTAAGVLLLNLAAFLAPLWIGLRMLESHEGD